MKIEEPKYPVVMIIAVLAVGIIIVTFIAFFCLKSKDPIQPAEKKGCLESERQEVIILHDESVRYELEEWEEVRSITPITDIKTREELLASRK